MIGILAHVEKPDAAPVTRQVVEGLRVRGLQPVFEQRTAALIGEPVGHKEPWLGTHCEMLVVIGGDGTILRAVHKLERQFKPILGINIGSLGFLTCAGANDWERAVQCIADKTCIISHRTLLDVTLESAEGKTVQLGALNDCVISRGERSQLVLIEVRINGEPLTIYNADGLILATPTGSTAYSLSAGGPILMPDSGAIVITPICPHVLTNRSTVVSDNARIEARVVEGSREVFVSVDGRPHIPMQPGDTLHIAKAAITLPIAMLPGTSFSDVLRQKLKWSGSNI